MGWVTQNSFFMNQMNDIECSGSLRDMLPKNDDYSCWPILPWAHILKNLSLKSMRMMRWMDIIKYWFLGWFVAEFYVFLEHFLCSVKALWVEGSCWYKSGQCPVSALLILLCHSCVAAIFIEASFLHKFCSYCLHTFWVLGILICSPLLTCDFYTNGEC